MKLTLFIAPQEASVAQQVIISHWQQRAFHSNPGLKARPFLPR